VIKGYHFAISVHHKLFRINIHTQIKTLVIKVALSPRGGSKCTHPLRVLDLSKQYNHVTSMHPMHVRPLNNFLSYKNGRTFHFAECINGNLLVSEVLLLCNVNALRSVVESTLLAYSCDNFRSQRVRICCQQYHWEHQLVLDRRITRWPCTKDWQWRSMPWTRLNSISHAAISLSSSTFALYFIHLVHHLSKSRCIFV